MACFSMADDEAVYGIAPRQSTWGDSRKEKRAAAPPAAEAMGLIGQLASLLGLGGRQGKKSDEADVRRRGEELLRRLEPITGAKERLVGLRAAEVELGRLVGDLGQTSESASRLAEARRQIGELGDNPDEKRIDAVYHFLLTALREWLRPAPAAPPGERPGFWK